ncbi:hypothetical protein D3C87_1499090 [compost metagenome]
MVVGVIETQLGVIERIKSLAQSQAVLAAVAGPIRGTASLVGTGPDRLCSGQVAWRIDDDFIELAAFLGIVADREESTAAIKNRRPEIVLIETFEAQGVCQVVTEAQHLDR